MRTPSPARPHTSLPVNPGRRSAPATPATTWQLSPELLADAVVAGYIHDISARHGHRATARWPRRGRGDRQ